MTDKNSVEERAARGGRPRTKMDDNYEVGEEVIEADPTGPTPPRARCCSVCVFLRSDPQGLQSDKEFWQEFLEECRWR